MNECKRDGRRFRTRKKKGPRYLLQIEDSHWARRGRVASQIFGMTRCDWVVCSVALCNIQLYVVSNLTHFTSPIHAHTRQECLPLGVGAYTEGLHFIIRLLLAYGSQLLTGIYIVYTWVQVHPSQYLMRRPKYSRASGAEDVRTERQSQSRTDRQTARWRVVQRLGRL